MKKIKDKKLNVMVNWFGDIKVSSKGEYKNEYIKVVSDVVNGKESIVVFFLLLGNRIKTIDIWERSTKKYNYADMLLILDDDSIIILLFK